MRFKEQPEFQTDPEVFRLSDTQTALLIYAEYVTRHSARPRPKFLEVDRSAQRVDSLWHAPVGGKLVYTRELELPAINIFRKPQWRVTRVGVTPARQDTFLLAYKALSEADYFPMMGDGVYWSGYRYMIVHVEVPPDAYWGQTNQWMGLQVECVIPPVEDFFRGASQGQLDPVERSDAAVEVREA